MCVRKMNFFHCRRSSAPCGIMAISRVWSRWLALCAVWAGCLKLTCSAHFLWMPTRKSGSMR